MILVRIFNSKQCLLIPTLFILDFRATLLMKLNPTLLYYITNPFSCSNCSTARYNVSLSFYYVIQIQNCKIKIKIFAKNCQFLQKTVVDIREISFHDLNAMKSFLFETKITIVKVLKKNIV